MASIKGFENVEFESGAGSWKMVEGKRYFIEPWTGDILELDRHERDLFIRPSQVPILGEGLETLWKWWQNWRHLGAISTFSDAVPLLIVRDDEKVTAALVESRIRNLRQSYAALVIAFGSTLGETFAVDGVDIETVDDLELLLPEEYRLVIVGAGVGTFGVVVQKAVEVVSKAPGKALDALTLFFKWGRDTAKIRAEALAGIKAAEKEAADLKNERTKDENEKAKHLDKVDIEKAQREEKEAAEKSERDKKEAAEKAERDRRQADYDFVLKQVNDYLDLRKRFDEIQDEDLRKKALQSFETNTRLMLPPSVIEKLPPPAA